MILVVSGWRWWNNIGFITSHLERKLFWYGAGQIHLRVGCCKTGADRHVRAWAKSNEKFLGSFTVYHADWDKLGLSAGPIRNGYMLRGEQNAKDPHPHIVADELLAFPQPGVNWCKTGSGTTGCIKDAKDLRVSLDVPGYRGPDMKEERKR